MSHPNRSVRARLGQGLPAVLLWTVATAAIGSLAFAMSQRVHAPFPLEWQEPAMLEHVMRLRSGKGVYVEPSLEFAAFPYPPLFHWLGALSCGLLGESLFALRIVSVLGVLAVMAALVGSFRWVAGIAACAWFAATYGWTGFWLDVARVDSLALGLGAVGFALVLAVEERVASEQRGAVLWLAVLAGLASALAVLAKQTQLGLSVALAIALLGRSTTRRAGLAYLVTMTLMLIPTVLWLERATSGWFLWTTVDLLRGSPFHGPAIAGFWAESVWVIGLPIGLALCAVGLATRGSEEAPGPRSLSLWLGCGALTLSAWAGRAHAGGFDNTLLPVALASAFACGGILRSLNRTPRGRWAGALLVGGATALLFPFPWSAVPVEADRVAFDEAVTRVDELAGDGEVWQPISALPPTRHGFLHKMALVDIAKSRETEVATKLLEELRVALSSQRFAAIVLEALPREGWGDLAGLIASNYEVAEELGAKADGIPANGGRVAGIPVTGASVHPRYVLLPRAK